jgi:hypothetical protein
MQVEAALQEKKYKGADVTWRERVAVEKASN